MKVFLTGGSGSIGRQLVSRLTARGDQPVILSRRADAVRRDRNMRGIEVVQGDPTVPGAWELALDGCDAVINLAGHNLFADRWNAAVKERIRDSRVLSTQNVVTAIQRAKTPPKTLVQASAIGFYGPKADDAELTEASPSGTDFMAVVCREWEDATAGLAKSGVRTPIIRTGVVLAEGEGALGAMTPIFKWLPGGAAPVGSGGKLSPARGEQWFSWIHVDDIVGIFLMALDHTSAAGPINGVSPNPVHFSEFARALARVLKRPFVPIGPPDAALNVILGEVAQVVTAGAKVSPKKAAELGYQFKHTDVLEALKAIFSPPKAETPRPAPKPQPAGHH
jgi:uncharacterized protein (TIGR01777 family)